MDAQTIAAQGTSTAANTSKEVSSYSREFIGNIRAKLGGISLDRIEQQLREQREDTARTAIELGMRLVLLKEMTPHGGWLHKLQIIGINDKVASRLMACVIRILSLPESDRLIEAAGSKSKLFELLVLDDEELTRLNEGEAVRGVSLTTLPETSVHTLRSMLKAGAAALPPDSGGWREDAPVWGEDGANANSNSHFEDPTDYPAVYALLPGDYNGWPISLIRHEGKSWLMASEVSAILATDGRELDEIQAVLDEWYSLGKPEGSLLKIRLASTSTVCLVIDKFAVEMLHVRLNTPASSALAAWFDAPPALAEVTPLHEAPSEPTPGDCLDKLTHEYDRAHLVLHNLVAQIKGVHELSELCGSNQTKLGIGEMAGMLAVTRELAERYEQLFEDMDSGIIDLRRTLKASAAIPA